MSILRLMVIVPLVAAVLVAPAWWLAPRLVLSARSGLWRVLIAGALALLGFVSYVNLVGRMVEHSTAAVWSWLALNAVWTIWLLWRRELRFSSQGLWRLTRGRVLLGAAVLLLALPQWFLAVSTNFWDEAVCGSTNLTAANQFAEGVFPPRHNAFPDIPIKYHYGFNILQGTVCWLTGVTANVSADVVSTALWLFIFLFMFCWIERLGFPRMAAFWSGCAMLLGGGLLWLYVPWLETYSDFQKVPNPGALVHAYRSAAGWLGNFATVLRNQNCHLVNGDGTRSLLPLDIANHFQQHSVSLAMGIMLLGLVLCAEWMRQRKFSWPLLLANVACFGLLFLANSVFGLMGAAMIGAYLLLRWLRCRTWLAFCNGLLFALGTGMLAKAHGGMLLSGANYDIGTVLKVQNTIGYALGGAAGFINWNLAGFGLPLLLALAGVCLRIAWRKRLAPDACVLFDLALLLFAISYAVPHILYYPYTFDINKFFYCARFALAVMSVYGVVLLARYVPRPVWLIAIAAMACGPVVYCIANACYDGSWHGFYRSPYYCPDGLYKIEIGKEFKKLKATKHDAFLDMAGDERAHGFLSELLLFGGSAFSLTPNRYERTGGLVIATNKITERCVQNGRMLRLEPGAAEDGDCKWLYTSLDADFAKLPVITRSRLIKMVDTGVLAQRAKAGPRVLYEVAAPTYDVDRGIEEYWRPRAIAQTRCDADGDGTNDLVFYDYARKELIVGNGFIKLPPWLRSQSFCHVYPGTCFGDGRVDFHVARYGDTVFRRGGSIQDMAEYNGYQWSYFDSRTQQWQAEYFKWCWDADMPMIVDLHGDGQSEHICYHYTQGTWTDAQDKPLAGGSAPMADRPIPVAGRFLAGSRCDLGVWSSRTALWNVRSLQTGATGCYYWGAVNDIPVPGDYDGDGIDELALWRPSNATWHAWRIGGSNSYQWTFGTASGVPMPADYNSDGRIDLGYWEPCSNMIYVSFSYGARTDREIPVPPHSIPAFVNMY